VAIERIALPDLGVYTAQELLYEAWAFAVRGELITVVTYLTSQAVAQRAAFVYDSVSQTHTLSINALLATQLGQPSADLSLVDVHNVQVYAHDGDTALAVLYSIPGANASGQRIAIIEAGSVVQAHLLDQALPGAELNITRILISEDGRFLAVQTTANLVPDPLLMQGVSDANEANDIYLLDRQSGSITMVSMAGGEIATSPSVLGDLRVDGNQLRLSFVSEAAFNSADTNGNSETSDGAADAYEWTQGYNESGLIGTPQIQLLSVALGAATGGVALAADGQSPEWAGPFLSSGATYFNSSSHRYNSQDSNDSVDAFRSDQGVITPVTWDGANSLSSGSQVVGVSQGGQVIALTTTSQEVAGPYGASKLVVTDTATNEYVVLPSANPSDQSTLLSSTLSPDGSRVAYATTSVSGQPQLYLADTDFSDVATSVATIHIQTMPGIRPAQALAGVRFEGYADVVTDADGVAVLSEPLKPDGVGGEHVLLPSKEAPSRTESAIGLSDVLATLKVYLGKTLPASYDSTYKYAAADFDGNGRVDLSDVLSLLKYYLGKPVDVAPAWVFADANNLIGGQAVSSQPGQTLSKTNAMPAVIDIDMNTTNETTVQLVGVLRGDLDGSWTA
jgi:hypothetical protein